MRRTRFKLPKHQGSFALNINSMTDMFTIMLVFLLQTYSTDAFELKQVKGLALPRSTVEKNATDALQVSISPTELKIEDDIIASLSNTEFKTENLDHGDTDIILPFLEKLQAYRLSQESSADSKAKNTGEIILQADRSLPYNTLKKIFYTASVAGFPKLKLATAMNN